MHSTHYPCLGMRSLDRRWYDLGSLIITARCKCAVSRILRRLDLWDKSCIVGDLWVMWSEYLSGICKCQTSISPKWQVLELRACLKRLISSIIRFSCSVCFQKCVQKSLLGLVQSAPCRIDVEFKDAQALPYKKLTTIKTKKDETEEVPVYSNKDSIYGEVSDSNAFSQFGCPCQTFTVNDLRSLYSHLLWLKLLRLNCSFLA